MGRSEEKEDRLIGKRVNRDNSGLSRKKEIN